MHPSLLKGRLGVWRSEERYYLFNLQAPNGQILDLIDAEGFHPGTFVNTTISSAGETPLSSITTGPSTYTGVFAADSLSEKRDDMFRIEAEGAIN